MNDKSSIKIGRTEECEIYLHDLTISRVHASIIMDKEAGCLYLEDNYSKFGSLIQGSSLNNLF
jgi:pSer/pThr/pTyr-binding forkhead associated (FHA) protein